MEHSPGSGEHGPRRARRTRSFQGHLAPWLVPCVVLGAGCGGGARESTPQTTAQIAMPRAIAHLEPEVAPLPPGVSASNAGPCTPASSDACNALDDDCDGRIDEGCGWESGPIQVTLAWSSGADLDLYVTDPSGFTISYLDRDAPSGGHLDHDARGACIPGGQNIENVHWTSSPGGGDYHVVVHYWGDCGVADSTDALVTVSVSGRIVGTYALTIERGQRRHIVDFTIPSGPEERPADQSAGEST